MQKKYVISILEMEGPGLSFMQWLHEHKLALEQQFTEAMGWNGPGWHGRGSDLRGNRRRKYVY